MKHSSYWTEVGRILILVLIVSTGCGCNLVSVALLANAAVCRVGGHYRGRFMPSEGQLVDGTSGCSANVMLY